VKKFLKFVLFLLALTFPLLIVLSAVRLSLTPAFISLEYHLPGFPPDPYGFSTEQRLQWADYSIQYLLRRVSHPEFSGQVLMDGSPLFNERELSHMLDVRQLTTYSLLLWGGLLSLLILSTLLSLILGEIPELMTALKNGVYITFIAIAGVFVFVAVNFNLIFTKFHELFFKGDTWLFRPSDNLIRLFPLRFWQDLFFFIGALSVLICVSILLIVYLHNRQKKVRG